MLRDVCSTVLTWLAVVVGASALGAGQDVEPATETEVAVPETDPVVLLIQQSEPSTPVELIQAAENLLNLNRPELAQDYLKKLQATQLDEAQLAQLVQNFGSAVFIRLP